MGRVAKWASATAVTGLLVGGSVALGVAQASADDCVRGAIAARYGQIGGPAGRLGAPTSCELPTARNDGRFTTFERGSIYWSSATGAWDVSGSFRQLWAASGWENGVLRYPTSGEAPARNGGVYQNYQGGTLYWTPSTGAQPVSGSFLQLYGSLGYENGFLGYPVGGENPIRSGGVYQLFQGGVAYWSPASGAHTVSGAFRDLYGASGFENGYLGYPTSQESPTRSGGVYQTYQGGALYWSPGSGAHAVGGAILTKYGEVGFENGALGFPTSNEYGIPGGRRSDFQNGFIEWSAATGARVNAPVGQAPTPPPVSTYYASCADARAAGAAPLYRGQPGYRPGLDRDGDGVACE